MESKKISVIVPIYNMEKHLKKCVNTLISQNYNNLQIILIDDGSTDSSWEICKELEKLDFRITAIHKDNGGVSSARNVGLDIARGEWIMFVDPDDYLDIAIVRTLADHISDEIDIVACTCTAFTNNQSIKCHFFDGNRMFLEESEKKDLYFQLLDLEYGQPKGKALTAIGVPWGKLYRAELLKKNNIRFNTTLRRVQDNIFNMYAFSKARTIVYIDLPLYYYRYEHMENYFNRYNPNCSEIFLPVCEARFYGLMEIGIFEDEDILHAYYNEVLRIFLMILRCELFHKDNQKKYIDKVKKCDLLMKKECIERVFYLKNLKHINGSKKKILFFLLCIKAYKMIEIILKQV